MARGHQARDQVARERALADAASAVQDRVAGRIEPTAEERRRRSGRDFGERDRAQTRNLRGQWIRSRTVTLVSELVTTNESCP